MSTIGLIAAVLFVYFQMDSVGLSFRDFVTYLFTCGALALMVSRVVFVISMLPQIEITLKNLLYYAVNGGIVFYGGLFGVLLGIVIVSKFLKKDCMQILDFVAPAFPLFHFFGRFGCLFAGCCYGVPWGWGVVMADSPSVIRFPVQFIESLCNITIFIFLLLSNRKTGSNRHNLKRYLLSYAFCRFVLEYFRGDSVRGIWMGIFTTSQIISIAVILIIANNTVRKLRLHAVKK